jgi:hypothetical protein
LDDGHRRVELDLHRLVEDDGAHGFGLRECLDGVGIGRHRHEWDRLEDVDLIDLRLTVHVGERDGRGGVDLVALLAHVSPRERALGGDRHVQLDDHRHGALG